ncbi:Na(+)-translocating NADH-quinone reductase subunit A [Eisenibacter elegans]|jgi:Na+-transporting NADH:ubiquinone oxidoreductase subunit A|uniref:Na(+)-translocating NADH-quinone reductase subunit A n=1 Tax=Eisenibacter elegans TaxID=997 RepID=UPI0004071A56|nr:Na(+)-translocating NADH-quinone reductase subunit A [Eisenibacter elegans]
MRVNIRKGFDINLKGKAAKTLVEDVRPNLYALQPTDFVGISRPKILVQPGDNVQAGTPLLFDKFNPEVMFTAPVSGEVTEIERGDRRKPLAIKILADKELSYVSFPKYDLGSLAGVSAEEARSSLLKSGVWVNLIERPFGLVANPEHTPKAIFISGFDSAPLAPDYEFVFKGQEQYLQAGIDILQKLTPGKIHISTHTQQGAGSIFKKLQKVTHHEFAGPHPAGNVGVQIHQIDPINKGEYVWTVTPYGLQQIGRLFLDGRYDACKVIVLAGSELNQPQYYNIINGAQLKPLLQGNVNNSNVRVISGNVLTGTKTSEEGFLGFYHTQVSVLPEGNHHEFLGWILPSTKKLSFQRAFGLLSFLNGKNQEYVMDTNLHGEERAFVQTGVFEQVLPMDIYPTFLLKAILSRDFEAMEELGIYEVLEEDFALCEFVDVSKMEIQALIREGLEALQNA